MSGITGKNTSTAFRKKDVAESRLLSIGFKKIRFMHKAAEGDTLIQLSSLTTPTEATANGFVQPSVSDLTKTDLYLFKENVELESTIRGKLTQFLSYVITGPSTIKLLFEAEENEIFTGIIDLSARTGSTLVDAEPLVSTGSLDAGETDFNVGTPFKVGMFPNAQHGAVMVYLDNQLVYRNSGNNPPGPGVDGEYYEVHAGGGLGVLIRFNAPDLVNDRNVTVVSIGSLVERPNGSLVALVEALQGQIDAIIPTVAELAGVDETDFQATPNNVDLKAFGDRVLTAENNIAQNTSDIAVRTWVPRSGIYENLVGTNINTTPQIIPFPTVLDDNNIGAAFAAGVFTAPEKGRYAFACNLFSVSSLSTSAAWYLQARKNSSQILATNVKAGTGTPNTSNAVCISGYAELEAGETLDMYSFLDAAGTVGLTVSQGFSTLHIWKVAP